MGEMIIQTQIIVVYEAGYWTYPEQNQKMNDWLIEILIKNK